MSPFVSAATWPSHRIPNPRRDLNGCQSFPVLGLVAREKSAPLQGRETGQPSAPSGQSVDNEMPENEYRLRKPIRSRFIHAPEKSLSISRGFSRVFFASRLSSLGLSTPYQQTAPCLCIYFICLFTLRKRFSFAIIVYRVRKIKGYQKKEKKW